MPNDHIKALSLIAALNFSNVSPAQDAQSDDEKDKETVEDILDEVSAADDSHRCRCAPD